jgi:predicted RNA-binding Zn ribbon-like protein
MHRTNNKYSAMGFGKEYPWMDLANTLEWNGFGKLTDHLDNPEWLSGFLKHWLFSAPTLRPIPVKQLTTLRGLLRRLSTRLSSGASLTSRDLAALNSYLNVPVRLQMFQRQNGVHSDLVPFNQGWAWIMARIAASFGEMLSMGRQDRLKSCPNKLCRWIFYDQTKGNTRRWCNDRTCGNRDRVRRARARDRSGRSRTGLAKRRK